RAFGILYEAGKEAVDAILEELEKGEKINSKAKDLLVYSGEPKAVPLLKRYLDRGDLSQGDSNLRKFIDSYPEYQGEVEKVHCAVCGMASPVTEMRSCEGKYFCKDTCWSKRGRVIEHGIATDCPYYMEGVCMAGNRDTGLCSLKAGLSLNACYVYGMY
ncbi:hypothetical protein MEO93_27050, partial [Dolichospermum sp. ST_sed3]|nr:hypothetical protein [Dolichospermum sp. ST_sed3]